MAAMQNHQPLFRRGMTCLFSRRRREGDEYSSEFVGATRRVAPTEFGVKSKDLVATKSKGEIG